MSRLLLLLLTCLAVGAAGQMSRPRIGFVRDLAGALRPVFGVAGAFVLGEPVLTDVVLAASAGETAVAYTGSEIVVVTGADVSWRGEAAGSPPVAFGFTATGRPSWVRFENGSCLIWAGKGHEPKMASFCIGVSAAVRLSSRLPEGVEGETEALAPGWLVLRSPNRLYAVRTGPDEAIFELPEAAQ